MEAKDMVIAIRKSVELPEDHSLLSMMDFTDKVAEISFKAGVQQECDEWMNADSSTQLAKAKQEGRKEVVEWVDEKLYGSRSEGYLLVQMTDEEWQAQKKKWGV